MNGPEEILTASGKVLVMKICISIGVICMLAILILAQAQIKTVRTWLSDVTMPIRHGIHRNRGVAVPMRDGVRLSTDVMMPVSGNGPYPVILIRTTYGGTEFKWSKFFVRNGYAVVVQHVRGRFGSGGSYDGPHRYSRSDGYDTIEWIVKQSWSTGKVGTFGCSYLGESQIMLAAEKHPNHIAMIVDGAGGAIGSAKNSYGYFGVYENGVLNLASSLGWFTSEGAKDYNITPRPSDYEENVKKNIGELPVSGLGKLIVPYETGYDDIVSHKLTDSWWSDEGYISGNDTFTVAALHVNSWYDQTVHDTFRLAELMEENALNSRAKHQHLIIGPGVHCSSGNLQTGLIKIGELETYYEDIDYRQMYLTWFDYWLKGKKSDLPPKYHYYTINTPHWDSSENWPPSDVEVLRLYLQKDGKLSEKRERVDSNDSASLVADQFTYDPLNPVPTIGGSICCTYRKDDIAGSRDQRILNDRPDVVIYRTDELSSDVNIAGNAKAVLFVSTNAPDSDFTVKLVDVAPDGAAYNLQDGVIRLRYREGIEKPKLAIPGEVYRIELELRPIAYRFKEGHKIAVYISSSNFPRLARNLNTGEGEYDSDRVFVAKNSIYVGNSHSSYIELPALNRVGSD